MLFYCPPLRKNGMAISGRARMAIVALIGRYMPKFTYRTISQVTSRRPTPIAEEIR